MKKRRTWIAVEGFLQHKSRPLSAERACLLAALLSRSQLMLICVYPMSWLHSRRRRTTQTNCMTPCLQSRRHFGTVTDMLWLSKTETRLRRRWQPRKTPHERVLIRRWQQILANHNKHSGACAPSCQSAVKPDEVRQRSAHHSSHFGEKTSADRRVLKRRFLWYRTPLVNQGERLVGRWSRFRVNTRDLWRLDWKRLDC